MRWAFRDPITGDNYSFEVNPAESGSPGYQTPTAYQWMDPVSGPIITEKVADIKAFQINGTLISQAQYSAMWAWYDKAYPIEVLDVLGRTFTVYLNEFTPKRVFSVTYPWRHSYTLSGIILDLVES